MTDSRPLVLSANRRCRRVRVLSDPEVPSSGGRSAAPAHRPHGRCRVTSHERLCGNGDRSGLPSAQSHGVDVLGVHTAWSSVLTRAGVTTGPPRVGTLPKFLKWIAGSAIGHNVLGRSWDRVAHCRGLVLTADSIHPSDRAGEAFLDPVEPRDTTALAGR